MADEDGVENYVNLIIFAVIYGILLIAIVSHAFIRWQVKRRSLTSWKPRTPGDNSFNNKQVRRLISADFENIRHLSVNPKLLQTDSSNSLSHDDSHPGYWYRMKAFDCGAEFVSVHAHGIDSSNSASLFLPHFLSKLQQKNVLPNDDISNGLVTEAVNGYKQARYNPGIFTKRELEKFIQLLDKLKRILSNEPPLSTDPPLMPKTASSSAIIKTRPEHDKATARYSQEPLLEGGHVLHRPLEQAKGSAIASEETDVLRSLSHSSGTNKLHKPIDLRSNRPVSLEIPLIDSQASTPLSTSSPFFGQNNKSTTM